MFGEFFEEEEDEDEGEIYNNRKCAEHVRSFHVTIDPLNSCRTVWYVIYEDIERVLYDG